jgi:ferric-dicitrate binding protein FerR (iron transport regulator)
MKTLILRQAARSNKPAFSLFADAPKTNFYLLLAFSLALSIPASLRASQQEPSKESLGSLTSLGEVYVNDSPTPVMSTPSLGAKIRTGESGEATLAVTGKGSLKIRPLSQIVLSGNDQYVAELEKGTVLVNSVPGADGLILRVGNYVVVSTVRSVATASRIARAEDGSFQVYCLDGKVGVLTLEGKSGQLLQAGQSLTISAKSELVASAPPPKPKGNSHTRWILLGLAGAGAAGAAAALAHGGGGNHTVTVAAP